ncbi:MAG: hypothetical protein QOH60_2156 [Mycobacterium sp.]|nr:hypothetical protein [Mycobacterium sp.]
MWGRFVTLLRADLFGKLPHLAHPGTANRRVVVESGHGWMTPPQYPNLAPPQNQPTPALRRAKARAPRSPIDIAMTAVMSVFSAAAGFGCFVFSALFAFGMGECAHYSDTPILVVWGGAAAAVIVAVSGITAAAIRGFVMWIWPTLAFGLIVAALVTGWQLAKSVTCLG